MKINFRKIASVLTSAVMLSSTIGLAAAANYPAPFVKGGSADVAVVYGTTAVSSDLVAVTDITSNLQAELASQTAVSGSTSSTASVSGGDYVKLAKTSDNVNLGNSLADVFGSRVDKDDLPVLLADGTYSNDENSEFDYEQSITLGSALNLTHFAESDYKDKEPTVGFNIVDNTQVLTYTLDFTTDAESDVSSGDLVDFESTDISILGKSYYILDAKNGTTQSAFGKFTLLDTANTISVSEGEAKTVDVGTTTHEVSIDSLSGSASSPKVKLSIDGEITNTLAEGETSKLKDGSYLGVKTISMRDIAGSIAKVEFSIGSGKLEIENGKDIELNDDVVDGVTANFTRASIGSGTKEKLDKLTIIWTTEDRMFITPTMELTMPGFEAVKLSMGQFFTPVKEVTKVENDGSDSIRLEVPLKDGTAKFNILYSDATTGNFTGIGKSATEKLATTPAGNLVYTATSGNDKWFVLSYATASEAESYLLSASVTESDAKNRTTIKNEVTGSNVCEDKAAGDTCNVGSASMSIQSVYKSGSTKWVNFTISGNNNFSTLYTKTGLKLNLPYLAGNESTAPGAVNFTAVEALTGHNFDTVYLNFTEEDKDDNIAAGQRFSFVINDNSDKKLQVSDMRTGNSEYEVGDTDKYVSYVYPSTTLSDLASMVTLDTNPDQDVAEIEYHGSESYADVFLTAVGATVTSDEVVSTTSSGTVKKLGSVAVNDAEVSSVSTKNLIVVGGSCVNSVAAELLGGALCGANFEAKTTVGAGSFLIQTFSRSGGKVATLVAGYNAADTTNAAKYLTTQSVDTTTGKTYVGTSATSAKLLTATTTSTVAASMNATNSTA